MKKIFMAIAAVAAVTLASCGGQTAGGDATDSDSIAALADSSVVEEPDVTEAQAQADAAVTVLTDQLQANDTEGLTKSVEDSKTYVQQLVSEGKTAAAQAYAAKIQEFVDANKEKLDKVTTGSTSLTDLISTVTSIPTSAEDAANAVKDAASAAATDAANAAADAAVDAAKTKATEAVNNAKDAAKAKADEAVSNAKAKADEAAAKAKEAAKAKANEAVNKAADEAKKKLGF